MFSVNDSEMEVKMNENKKSFMTIATSFDTLINMTENHTYVTEHNDVSCVSVTGILHPAGVPKLRHIEHAADYGTQVHSIISDFLLKQFSVRENTELAVKSAKVIVSKLNEFLTDFKPKKIYRGERTKLTPQYLPDVKMLAKYLPTNANIGGAADLVVDVTTENGSLSTRVVVEFKTTKNTSKDHKLQVAAYMEFLGAQHGLVIYDDPGLPNVYIDLKEQKDLMKCFTKKANDYFFEDMRIESDDAEQLESIVLDLKELQAKVKELEAERNRIAESIITKNEKAVFALQFGVEVIVGNTKIQMIENTTRSVDTKALKESHPILYKKFVKESKYYCRKFHLLTEKPASTGGN